MKSRPLFMLVILISPIMFMIKVLFMSLATVPVSTRTRLEVRRKTSAEQFVQGKKVNLPWAV